MYDAEFWKNVILVFMITWLPVFFIQRIYKMFNKEVSDIV